MNRLRNFSRGLLGAALIISLSACGQQPVGKTDAKTLIKEESQRLTQKMQELAANEEYQKVVGLPDNLEEEVRAIAAQDLNQPQEMYTLSITGSFFLDFISEEAGDISEVTLKELNRRLNASYYANLLNSLQGADAIVTASLLSCNEAYIEPEDWEENTLVILKYPGNYSSMVSFTEAGEGVIGGWAYFVKTGDKDIVEEIERYLSLKDSDLVKIE